MHPARRGPAKTSPPRLSCPLPRPRLFERLDAAREHAVVWIAAPPGSGKTTLVSSYLAERQLAHIWYRLDASDGDLASFFHELAQAIDPARAGDRPLPPFTPEYLTGLRTFARRYLEAMAESAASPRVLVLDNFEQVPDDARLARLLPDLAADLPTGLTLFVLSRTEPPACFARLRLYEDLALLDAATLNLTLEEAHRLAWHRLCRPVSDRDRGRIEELHAATGGWFAGFQLLLAEHGDAVPLCDGPPPPDQLLFDYFASELFEQLAEPEQRVLLRTAVLPNVTSAQVRRLSGEPDGDAVLVGLQRRGYFITQLGYAEPVYEYHPLFRTFLLQRATALLPPDDWRDLHRTAALVAAEAHQPAEAARLFAVAEDWPALETLVLREAPDLIATGRYQTLAEWLACLPEAIRAASPWLLYWSGAAQMPLQPAAARARFERAFALFTAQDDDVAGLYLAWSSVVESYLAEWRDFKPLDPWIETLAALRSRHPRYPSPHVELRTVTATLSLMFRSAHTPDLHDTVEQARALLRDTSEAVARGLLAGTLLLPALWLGDFALATRLKDILEPQHETAVNPPFVTILGSVYLSAYYWNIGCPRDCIRIVDEAHALAQTTGMQAWNFLLHAHAVYGHLAAADLDQAELHLQRLHQAMPCHTHLMGGHYCYLAARLAERRGDLVNALELATAALAMVEDAGSPVPQHIIRLTLAAILQRSGDADGAAAHLRAVRRFAERMGSAMFIFQGLISEADAAFQCGDAPRGLNELRTALALSRARGGIGMLFHWSRAQAAATYARALAAGIEVEHVQLMIRRGGLAAPDDGDDTPDAWPWPVKLHALGALRIVRDGQAVPAAGKTQQKPLELLMFLLCGGNRAVPKESAVDALWPEADGDHAYRALITNLHRLRQLLGHPEAIRLQDGCLALDPRVVWVDAWMLERRLGQAARDTAAAVTPCEQALSLYRGAFLPQCPAPWAVRPRERLQVLFREHLLRRARHLESAGDDQQAVDCYLRGIAVDDGAEAFYQRLIELYLRQGRLGEARDLYQSCARALGTPRPPALQTLHSLLSADA